MIVHREDARILTLRHYPTLDAAIKVAAKRVMLGEIWIIRREELGTFRLCRHPGDKHCGRHEQVWP